jgi:hypothetical protein
VCPTQAILSGDLDDSASLISQLTTREPVRVRKPEKGTVPQLFYIDADENSLTPSSTTLPVHLLIQALLAGSAALAIVDVFVRSNATTASLLHTL